ncbi:MAG: hypothetical protein RLZ98_2770 [Pseudomonadota bacterium]
MASIGTKQPRLRDRELLSGRGNYVDDVQLPGGLHAAFVRSTHAHARIAGIDVSTALAVDGVAAAYTVKDIAKVAASERMTLIAAPVQAKVANTPFILAKSEVAYVGELIAIVLAETRHQAEDGANAILVDYEPLEVVVDPRKAIEPGAPRVRTELGSNVFNTYDVAYGDIEAAFSGDVVIVKDSIFVHRGAGHPMEGRGIVVENRAREDAMTVWSSTQMPNDLFQAIVETIGIDENRLRVITPDVGGGFGPKYCVYPEELAVVCAAKLSGRSVKWIEDRREHFLGAIQERDQHWDVEIAVTRDGKLKGVRGHLIHCQGAYTFKAANLPYNSATAVPGPYMLPAYKMDVTVAFTNRMPVSSVRGAGYPQAVFVMERLMDRAAQALGLDRAEIRRRNLIPPEKLPYEKPLKARSGSGIIYDSGDYPAAQARLLEAADWERFKVRQEAARKEGCYLGIGLANAVKGTGRGPFESGSVRITPSGRVTVMTGAAEMGQGLTTALAQIAADELGIRPEQVTVVAGDTSMTPLGLGGFASRQLVTAGSTVKLSAIAVAEKAKKLASHILEADVADLELRNGSVSVVGAPGHGVTLAEIARQLRGAPGYAFPEGLDPGLEADEKWQAGPLAYANVSHVAEVEVDIETGHVRLLRFLSIQDSGTLINPALVEGQVRGGITHGIGNAMFEVMKYDAEGQPQTTTFADYLLATAPEIPRFETMYEQSPSPFNPLGAKGVGEVGTIPAAAAVISAIEDALSPFGARISKAPIEPEDVLRLVG